MTALDDARAHLGKAREFLDAGRFNLDLRLFNAATSAAVISGINSKDAICLRLTGTTHKAEGHHEAVAELEAAGPAGAAGARTQSVAEVEDEVAVPLSVRRSRGRAHGSQPGRPAA